MKRTMLEGMARSIRRGLSVGMAAVVAAVVLLATSAYSADNFAVKSAGGATLFNVTDTGLLGAGISIPQYIVDVSNSGASKSSLHFSKDGSDVGGWLTTVADTNFFLSAGAMYDASAGGWVQKSPSGVAAILGGDTPGFTIYTSSGAAVGAIAPIAPRVRITPTGNVGIGVTSPVYPLQIASGAYVSAGGVWTNASSREYKENIEDLTTSEAVEALKELKAVKYNYKADSTDRHVGFIAEDVPELVATKDRKGLSPMDIVAVLTKVVQEKSQVIDKQQKTIDDLAAAMAQLKAEVQRLKAANVTAMQMQ